MQADSVGGGHNSTGDDVVAVHQGTSNWLTNSVDIDRGRGDERHDEADGRSQQGGDHENPKPTDVNTVVGAGNPLAERFPGVRAGT